MFSKHPVDQLVERTCQLHYFRYVRTPREADTLEAKWLYKDIDEIKRFAERLGFEINVFDEKPAQAVVGVSYSHLERFAALIPGTKWWEEPGNVNIDGENVYISCTRDTVHMSIFHGGGEVYAEQFESAIRLETKLLPLKLKFVVPAVDEKYCFSESTYPDCF